MSNNTIWILTLFLGTFRAFSQSDTLVCLDCSFKKRALFIQEQSNRLKDTSVAVKVYDYSMTYINSLLIQDYLGENVEIESFPFPTHSNQFKNKYYRKVYNRLKLCDSVEYIGMMPDEHLDIGVQFIYSMTDRSKVKTNKEIEVYNELLKMSHYEDYDLSITDIYWLFDNILSYSDQLNIFENKPLVLSLCENYLRNKGKEHSLVENKMMIVYEARLIGKSSN